MNTELRFGSDVDQSIRDALAADPNFVHPEMTDHPMWVIENGMPVAVPVVGLIRRGGWDWTVLAYVIRKGSVVYSVPKWAAAWSKDEVETMQAELDGAFDL